MKRIKSIIDWIICGIGPIFLIGMAGIVVNICNVFCEPIRIVYIILFALIVNFTLINMQYIYKGYYPPNIENIATCEKSHIRRIFLFYMAGIQMIVIAVYIFCLIQLPILFLVLLLINFITSIFLIWKSKASTK